MAATPVQLAYMPPGCTCPVCTARAAAATMLTASSVQASAAPVKLKIDFLPATTTTIVPGYRADIGRAYGVRANGRSYGWSTSNENAAVQRDTAGLDPRASAFIKTTVGKKWEAAVPTGYYQVHIVSGDPTSLAADYRFSAEGSALSNGDPKAGHPFVEGFATVYVTDGRLTITTDAKSVNSNISLIEIRSVAAPATVPAGAPIAWTRNTVARAPVGRVEAGSVTIGDNVYVLGGFTENYLNTTQRVDVLNTKTNKWSRLADLPGGQTHAGVATDGTSIYWVSGQYGPNDSTIGTNEGWKYDIATNTWSRMQNLPEIRFGGAMSYVNGTLHFFGGADKTRVTSQADQWTLDTTDAAAEWKSAAPMPLAADHLSQIVVNGQIYAIGGEIDHGVSYLSRDTMFRYNIKSDTWTEMKNMPYIASHTETAVLSDGKRIFVLGGQGNAQEVLNGVRSYVIADNTWETHNGIPAARKGGVAYLIGNKLTYYNGDELGNGLPTDRFIGIIG